MPQMSPEIDLLERLWADDASLYECAYGSCHGFRDLPHAARVISIYLKTNVVELYDSRSESKASIPYHTARFLLEDDANWSKDARYFLRITERGYRQFVNDSAAFFDKLFSKDKG